MSDFIREYGGAIVAFLIELSLFLLAAASVYISRQRIQNELASGTSTLWFPYEGVLKWFLGIGAFLMFSSAVFTSLFVEDLESWIPLIFLVGGGLCAYPWYYMTGGILIDPYGVTQIRLWAKKRIDYTEITHTVDHTTGHYLVIHAPRKRIRVEYQLQEFSTFVNLLYDNFAKIRGERLPMK